MLEALESLRMPSFTSLGTNGMRGMLNVVVTV